MSSIGIPATTTTTALTETTETILTKVKNGELTIEQAQTRLDQLKVSELKKVTYKVSQKGAISFYGLGQMPITLYQNQLQAIVDIANSDDFKKFLKDHVNQLVTKERTKQQ